MKKLIVGAVLALAVAAFLPRAASAGIWENGNWSNGIWENGVDPNGISLNGFKVNGTRLNGPVLQGFRVNGLSFQGFKVNGFRVNGALLQGVERPAGPQCTERGVDLSAVPLAKVTVRLPQPVR